MRTRTKKWGCIALLLCFVSTTTSCVYLRLNALRKQLADFETYCTFENEGGPAVNFQKPVIKSKDITWLFGLEPSSISPPVKKGESEQHTWVFKKLPPEGKGPPTRNFSIEIQCSFVNGRMNQLKFPEGMDDVLDEEVIDQLFRQADRADVATREKKSSWGTSEKARFPDRAKMLRISGRPTEKSATKQNITLVYKYHLEGKETPEDQVDGQGTLTYDRKSGKMTHADIFLGHLHISLARPSKPSTTPEGESGYHVTMKRSKS